VGEMEVGKCEYTSYEAWKWECELGWVYTTVLPCVYMTFLVFETQDCGVLDGIFDD
jgi:hypothetical protein